MAREPQAAILLLANKRNWAYDFTARSLSARLHDRFRISVRYVREYPDLHREHFDLLYVFWWGERWHQQFDVPPSKVVRHISSHRWQLDDRYGRLSPADFAREHLSDCRFVTTSSERLQQAVSGVVPAAFHCPVGFEPGLFHPAKSGQTGSLRVGWVGNPGDPCKGLHDVVIPACSGRYDLTVTSGKWSRARVARLYQAVDVLLIASEAEGEPLPLLEGLASGCYPVTTDVGVVPEVIRSANDGLVVRRSVDSFREALAWCDANRDRIRATRLERAQRMKAARSWDHCARRFAQIFHYALSSAGDVRPPAPAAQYAAHNDPDTPASSQAHLTAGYWRRSDRAAEVKELALRHVGKLRHRFRRAPRQAA